MARRRWTRYGRRRMRGLRRRLGFSVRRRRRTSYRWRRRRGYSSTRSRVVKLVATLPFTFYAQDQGPGVIAAQPFRFSPGQFPGFLEYFNTHSEFRLLKAVMNIPTTISASSQQTFGSFRRISSRAHVVSLGFDGNIFQNKELSFARTVDQLTQSKFQKLITVSDVRNSVTVSFYPYTLSWQGRPIGTESTSSKGASFLQYQSGKRWCTMSFLGAGGTATTQDDVFFFGPYIIPYLQGSNSPPVATTTAGASWTANVQVTLYAQFRGQK